MLRYLPFMIFLGVVIYALIDCATTKKEDAKHLPKVAWLILIVLFPLLGSLGWLIAGRNRRRPSAAGGRAGGGSGGGTGGGRRSTWVAPDDNPEFLKKLGDENAKDDSNEGTEDDGDEKGDGDGRRDGGPRKD
ncbi:PLD nuclease N-terminal domain-containing protein [Streptomyces sp. WMMC500]|uniref:PLD nuclease N-terminal domain-containing protein n=1 Tax=Streptomyces sp. WMMC500 TaxID=3015154 RepID=UPI00248BACB8|nr:PLD nuclease N-terminal domain-containing protein [Streptomyces sp. WMMC500]WBB63904.1 PLD nuclease N-terminal domain-containing protein [Streptomyces sp. WMMC500]